MLDYCTLEVCTRSETALALMNNKHIAVHFQDAVKASHGIILKEECKKWTSHSIRVGSCVFLREGIHDGPFINAYLLWNSDKLLLHLRNTSYVPSRHSATIS